MFSYFWVQYKLTKNAQPIRHLFQEFPNSKIQLNGEHNYRSFKKALDHYRKFDEDTIMELENAETGSSSMTVFIQIVQILQMRFGKLFVTNKTTQLRTPTTKNEYNFKTNIYSGHYNNTTQPEVSEDHPRHLEILHQKITKHLIDIQHLFDVSICLLRFWTPSSAPVLIEKIFKNRINRDDKSRYTLSDIIFGKRLDAHNTIDIIDKIDTKLRDDYVETLKHFGQPECDTNPTYENYATNISNN